MSNLKYTRCGKTNVNFIQTKLILTLINYVCFNMQPMNLDNLQRILKCNYFIIESLKDLLAFLNIIPS